MIGPAMDTALSRYLAGPLVPTVLGRDARLQLLHEQDALGALERATMAGKAGHLQHRRQRHHHDVAGDPAVRPGSAAGAAIRRCGAWIRCGAPTRYTELNREQLDYLSYGRVMDTTRMRKELGYQPEVDDGGGVRRLRTRSWIDSDYRPAMGTLRGESRRSGGAALG